MANNVKELEIKIEGKEWKEAIDKAFNEENNKVKIDGFRKGKAPYNVFIKKYGLDALLYKASDKVIEVAYGKMLSECKKDLATLAAKPEIELSELTEEHVIFKFTLTMKPEVKLGKYKGLEVKKEECNVTSEEIADAIESIRKRYSEGVIKDGSVENGDVAVIDFEGFLDGKAFEGGKGEHYPLTIGSGSFIPGFEEQLIGMEVGEERDIKVTFPADYHAEDLKGKEVTFKVLVHEIKTTVVPELDADFFADLAMEGVNSKEELEAYVSDNILKHKEANAEDKYLDELLEAAAKNTTVDVPEAMINDELDRMIEQYGENLKNQGLSLEQFYQYTNSDEEALRSQMREEAIRRITYRLMLEEIAKAENIEVSDEEASKEADNLAEKYQMEKDEFLKMFGGLEIVKYDLKMRRAMDVLKG